ncbi:hypothetical protein P9D14_15705 [Bacillus velezensis]|uniref:hypothetical protein n=1 Tax=Bacillus amyloliquefaciens group TaxID=1938374 RepID=UPI001780FA7B|nr:MULTISPECIES: hypothetical protein [Bacillus amyloliquefaciens group]MEC1384960.1 hypothetical protein [Bacillus velezensis]QOH64968.1 hypothetical protein DKG78_01700 [Bacillus amyloliquefaciens]
MKIDMQTYKETVQKIETDLIPRSQNDKELLTYLMKQDSLTLNQMKMCFTEPSLTFQHTVKIVCTVTFITLYIFFFSTHFNDLIEMALQMVFGLAGLVWVIAVFPFSRKIQVSDRFRQKSENTRITGMIDFVLEQRYKDMIS